MPPVDRAPSLFGAIARIVHDTNGATAAVIAIVLPGLIGFGALGAETGVWFTIKLQNQAAADAAAISAAYQIIAGKTNPAADLIPAADEAAARNGYRGSTPTVVYPYTDGVISNGVAVTLQQTQGALLAAMFLSSVTLTNKAVAVVEASGAACILALATGGTGVEVADLTHVDMPACLVAANSVSRTAIELHGSTSSITAATLVTAGEASLQGNPVNPAAPPPELVLASPVKIGAPATPDPYSGSLTHGFLTASMPVTGRCRAKRTAGVRVYQGACVVSGSTLKQPSIKLSADTQISGTWTIATGQAVDLSPGTYWVTGDLTVQSGAVLKCSTCDNVLGVGVTIILAAQAGKVGALSIASSASANLNAPRSGPFSGLVIVQDANGLPPGTTYSSTHSTIGGGSAATINGLVYFPSSSMTFHGNPSVTGPKCLLLVIGTLNVDAASSLEIAGCRDAGLTVLPTVSTVALAE